MTESAPTRTATAVDALAEDFLAADAALDPISATNMGLAGFDALMPDLSPDGLGRRAELTRATLAKLDGAVPADETDRVTIEAMRERLEVAATLDDRGDPLSELNNITSPVQTLRAVFDLMPTETVQNWTVVSQRLARYPGRHRRLPGIAAAGRLPGRCRAGTPGPGRRHPERGQPR